MWISILAQATQPAGPPPPQWLQILGGPFLPLMLGLLLAGLTAQAANLGFLGNAPISRMTAEDVDMLYDAVVNALDNAKDGERTGWENPATSASGTLTPLDTYSGPAGNRCRHLQVISRAGGLRNQSVFALCKQPDGKWKAQTE